MKIREKEDFYLDSVKNNIFLDSYFNEFYITTSKIKVNSISPTKFFKYFQKYGIKFRIVYKIIIILSPILVISLLTIKMFRLTILKFLYQKGKSNEIINDIKLAVLTQPSILRQLDKMSGYEGSKILIPHFVDYNFKDLKKSNKIIHSFNYIKYSTILYSYFSSFRIIFKIWKVYGLKNVLYSLNSFDWFILFDIINNSVSIDTELIFSNQKDRWAYLYDNCIQKNKTLVQHGTNKFEKISYPSLEKYFEYLPEYDSWVYKIINKYKTVNKLFAFNKMEANHTVKCEFIKLPDVLYIGYDLKVDYYKSDKKVVLIVGKSDHFAKIEKFIISSLDLDKYEILVKPHPLTKKESYSYILPEGKLVDFNPVSDIVIGYNSTLINEYNSIGTKTYIYHDFESAKFIVEELND